MGLREYNGVDGKYRIRESSTTLDDLTLRQTTLNQNSLCGFLIEGNLTNLEIDGCELNGNDRGLYAEVSSSTYGTLNNVTINNSTFNNNTDEGFLAMKLNNATIDSLTATGNGNDGMDLNFAVTGQSTLTLTHCNLSQNTRHGFQINTGEAIDGLTISNTTCSDNTADGLRFDGDVTNLQVNSVTAERNRVGFYAKVPDASGTTLDQVTISSSTFSNNDNEGMYIERLSNAILEQLTLENNGLEGIDLNLLRDSFEDITVRNSRFSGNGSPAALAVKVRNDLYVGTDLTGVLDVNNNILANSEAGILLGEPSASNTASCRVDIEENDLSDYNAPNLSVRNELSGNTANLICNWHGDASGPPVGTVSGALNRAPTSASTPLLSSGFMLNFVPKPVVFLGQRWALTFCG